MGYFASIGSLLLYLFSFNYLTKIKSELLFPVINLSTIVLLYIFGMCKILYLGGYLILSASIFLTIICLILIVKKKDFQFLKKFFLDYYFLIIVTFAIAQFFALQSMDANNWDELTHWGLVVKNMYYYKNFGGGPTATTMFKGYPLGSSLFLYYFVMFGATFKPAHMFMAMNILNISLLLPILSKFEFFKQKLISFVLIIITTLVFYHVIFCSIWNDGFMAICFAYILVNYFCFIKNDGLPIINFLSICLASFVLISSKETGLAFTLFAYIIIALDLIIYRRNALKSTGFKKSILALFIICICVVIPKLTWKLYLKTISIGGAWNTEELTLSNIIQLVSNPNDFQLQVVRIFFNGLLIPPVNAMSTIGIPYIVFVIIILLGIILLHKFNHTETNGFGWSLCIGFILTFLFYLVGLLVTYIFSFSTSEALGLASYGRYITTYIHGFVLLLVSICMSQHNFKTEFKYGHLIIYLITCFTLILCGVSLKPIIDNAMEDEMGEFYSFAENVNNLPNDASIYIIQIESNGYIAEDYFKLRYLATPHKCSGYLYGGSPWTGNPFFEGMTPTQTITAILDGGYNTLYLHNINEKFVEDFGYLFSVTPTSETFYSITILEDTILFQPI